MRMQSLKLLLLPLLLSVSFIIKGQETTSLNDEVAGFYIKNYLDKLPVDSLLKKKYIKFMIDFSSHILPSGNTFKLFYNKPAEVDQLMNQPRLSRDMVDFVIWRTNISPQLWKDNVPVIDKPDWDRMYKEVRAAYGKTYADRNISKAKLSWYNKKRDTANMIKYYIEKIDSQGVDLTQSVERAMLNNFVYEYFFKHSEDKKELDKAIGWMKLLLDSHPANYSAMDTYAGLLYKTGRKKDAIQWQRKSLELATQAKDTRSATLIGQSLLKMEKGEKTW